MTFPRARAVIEEGLATRAFPALACDIGRAHSRLWCAAFGRLSYDDDAAPCTTETVFDLASLTKVIVTTSVAMRLERDGLLDIDAPVSAYLPEWTLGGRAVTVRHLLDHSSGLPAHRPLWHEAPDAASLVRAVMAVPLERTPGTSAVYSDLGFMLLGFVLERIGGASLRVQWHRLYSPQSPSHGAALDFLPDQARWSGVAPTEVDAWRGRLLQGEVHDEHAALLGGVAAHAGLFGSVDAVGRFAASVLASFHQETWLSTPAQMRQWASVSQVEGSSRALGWDTMRPTSSCGSHLSASSIGHTGFTGTSIWIDWERDLYVVLLSNRVHPTRRNEAFVAMRARIHDAVMTDLTA